MNFARIKKYCNFSDSKYFINFPSKLTNFTLSN